MCCFCWLTWSSSLGRWRSASGRKSTSLGRSRRAKILWGHQLARLGGNGVGRSSWWGGIMPRMVVRRRWAMRVGMAIHGMGRILVSWWRRKAWVVRRVWRLLDLHRTLAVRRWRRIMRILWRRVLISAIITAGAAIGVSWWW